MAVFEGKICEARFFFVPSHCQSGRTAKPHLGQPNTRAGQPNTELYQPDTELAQLSFEMVSLKVFMSSVCSQCRSWMLPCLSMSL